MDRASIKSLIFSFTIHCVVIAAFASEYLKKHSEPKVSLVIEAAIIGNVAKEMHDDVKENPHRSESHKHVAKKDLEHEEHQHDLATKVAPIYQPLPDIPQDLRYDAFNSQAIARFYILPSGEVEKVDLIKPCANPRLNHLLLKSLKDWKFPSNSKSSTQDIRVTFRVE